MAENQEKKNEGSNQSDDAKKDATSIDYLTKQAQESDFTFGSTGHEDINKNLGSFGNNVPQPKQTNETEIKLDVDTKVVEQASKEKIDFERFNRTRRTEKAAKTKFGEKVSMVLRSKKGLRRVWIIELLIMVVTIALSASFIGILSKYKGASGDGPLPLADMQKQLSVGLVFGWISMFPCLIPLIYLVTTWFIGINQVASSRNFHYMFWICCIIAIVCCVVGIGCMANPLHWAIRYPPF